MDAIRHQQFAKLFLENQHRIYRYVLMLCPNTSEAEDLFQATSLTMWEHWESYDPSRPMLPWAIAIAKNQIRNHRRKSARRGDQWLSDEVMDRVAATAARTQGRVDRLVVSLDVCIEALPARQGELLREHYMAEQPVAKVAERHGMSLNAMYKALRRARATLLECMNRRAGEQE